MFCRKCGAEIRPGAKFCVKCGTPVKTPETEMAKKEEQEVELPKIELPEEEQEVEPPKIELPAKSNRGIIIALICFIILLLGAGAAMFIYFSGQSSRQEAELEREKEQNREDADEMDDKKEQVTEDAASNEAESTAASTEQSVSTEQVQTAIEAEDASQKIHSYQIVTADVTWTEAYQAAKNVPNGYLVNINTEEEWSAIINQIKEQGYEDRIFWIGAMRRGDSSEYYWVDGDGKNVGDAINGSSHWLSGEPTFYDSENNLEERYVDMFHSSAQDAWVWNDTPDDLISLISYYSGKIAYIVEIEE